MGDLFSTSQNSAQNTSLSQTLSQQLSSSYGFNNAFAPVLNILAGQGGSQSGSPAVSNPLTSNPSFTPAANITPSGSASYVYIIGAILILGLILWLIFRKHKEGK